MEAKKLTEAIQCTDKESGKVGTFLHSGDFKAISPVYASLISLYDYERKNCLKVGYVDGNKYMPIFILKSEIK